VAANRWDPELLTRFRAALVVASVGRNMIDQAATADQLEQIAAPRRRTRNRVETASQRRAAEAFCELALTGSCQLAYEAVPTCHDHEYRFRGAPRFRPDAGCPVDVGSDHPDASDVPEPSYHGGDQCCTQGWKEAFVRDRPVCPERPANVLVVDKAVRQPDCTAETAGQPVRIGVIPEQR